MKEKETSTITYKIILTQTEAQDLKDCLDFLQENVTAHTLGIQRTLKRILNRLTPYNP